MKRNIILVVLLLIAQLEMINGQVVTQLFDKSAMISKSYFSSVEKTNSAIPLKEISAFNTDVRLKDDSISGIMDKGILHCFGQKIEVGFSLDDGVWTKIEGGSLWCLDLTSAQAIGMNVGFENLYIPEGVELYVVNADQTMVYGPVTSSNVPENHALLTDFLDGERIRIYLHEPENQKSKSQLYITSIGHAFSTAKTRGGALLPCHNDVMCYSGWQRESNAIVRIQFPKGDWYYNGTGALIMNTRKDFKAYILTAFHCVDKNRNNWLSEDEINAVSQCIFTFGYKKNACNGAVGSVITFNGAKLRAAWLKTDMALLELNGVILSEHNLSFLGWDRSGKDSSRGTCIHHPVGRDMKISFTNQQVTVINKTIGWEEDENIYYWSEPNTHWECVMTNGTAQYGSSGGPLLNVAGKVIGQLHGGQDICPPVSKYFGRFDLSWEGGGTPATQLKHWLDPDNTGAVTMNTQCKEWSISGSNDSYVRGSTVFTARGIPEGATVSWSISFPSYFALSQVDNQSVKVVPYKYEVSASLVGIVSQNGMVLDRLTRTITSLPLSISGDDYISGLLSTCNINYLPEGGTLAWRCSDGIDIDSYHGTKINFKGCNVKEPWLEAVVTDADGMESIVRHNLNIATVESAELTLLKTWYAENSEGANVKKYAYRVVFKPYLPLKHLNFCWSNSVTVNYKNSDRPHLNIMGGAKMRTAGDISICHNSIVALDSLLVPTPGIVMPFASPIPRPEPDYPLIIEQSTWSQTRDHVIVEMPVIDLNETAEGYLTCIIQDYCENSATAMSKELLFTQWNYVYHTAPNPANDVITISRMIEGSVRNANTFSLSAPETITANLYNNNTLVRSFKFDSTQGNADMHVGNLPEGTYYLNILERGKVVGSQVVLIQR